MGLFSFIKEAGEKLFGGKEVEAAVTQAAGNPAAKPSLDALNQQAARAIETYIASQKLGVEGVSVEYDGATGTVQMRAELPNPGQRLLPGQYVRVKVLAGTQQAIVVPQTAVLQNDSGRFVWVTDGEKAMPRPVRTGNWLGADWVILDGLKEGDRVIVDNLVRLRPGIAVALK